MLINAPISLGELFDKISILKIKEKNIFDQIKLKLIKDELNLLEKKLNLSVKDDNEIKSYLNELIAVNSKLWTIEDELRQHERKKVFNNSFISLARSVYIQNDLRAKIKLEINKKFGSKVIEVKSYEEY
tara:strand:- start:128 stop:514 length:387 start_codon:yes stop_codon:yes gene_type:complete